MQDWTCISTSPFEVLSGEWDKSTMLKALSVPCLVWVCHLVLVGLAAGVLPRGSFSRDVTDPPKPQDPGSLNPLPGSAQFLSLLTFPRLFQGAFPGNLQLVFVLRPSRFIQRAIADIGIKLYRDDFKMKVPVSTFLSLVLEFFGSCGIFSSSLSANSFLSFVSPCCYPCWTV